MRLKALLQFGLCIGTLGFGVAAAADGTLTRSELAKRGKPATALVLVEPGGISGTAFIIHPDGWLVTNEHVVAAASRPGGRVRVALRPGEADQKVLPARVVRTDKQKDLAVVRVDGEKGLPALPLGDSDRLTELAELVGFGFPFGTQLATTQEELPAVTVTASSVTSLRRQGRVLAAIQLDGAVNPGHSGGPLLAADGTVVGVIRSGIRGAQISQAIPANLVKAFLAAPDVSISPPTLDRAALAKPAEFRADVVSLLPAVAVSPAVELILDTGEAPPRKMPMAMRDGAYRATVVPLPRSGPATVGVTARFGPVTIAGPVPDRQFTAGGKAMTLSQVRRLESGAAGRAIRQDGGTVAGPLAGLDGVELPLADQTIRLDLSKADSVDLLPPAAPAALTCTAVATVSGKVVGRATTVVPLSGSSAARRSGPGAAVTPSAMVGDRIIRPLPDTFSDVCAGGGGKYLLFGLPKQGKIAVFDVAQAQIVHYFPAADPGAKFAAGVDNVVVALPGPHVLQRWSLTTFERELSVPFPTQDPIESVLLGHAARGPVLANAEFLALDSLKPIGIKWPNGPITHGIGRHGMTLCTSADGTVIGSTSAGGVSPAGLNTAVLAGNEVKTYYQHTTPGYVVPSPDGRLVYTAIGVFTNDLKPVIPLDRQHPARFLPAVHGSLYFGVRMPDPLPRIPGRHAAEAALPTAEVSVYATGDARPLAALGPVAEDLFNSAVGEPLGFHKRLWLVPDAHVFVVLPATRDAVHLIRFDLDAALEKSGTDYLFVVSDPPAVARTGGRYTHRLAVKSKRGGVRCKLDSGPDGMTVTPAGLIEWPVPADFAGKTATVIVSVADASEQEMFKTFTIQGAADGN
jgi:hypothetical protein